MLTNLTPDIHEFEGYTTQGYQVEYILVSVVISSFITKPCPITQQAQSPCTHDNFIYFC